MAQMIKISDFFNMKITINENFFGGNAVRIEDFYQVIKQRLIQEIKDGDDGSLTTEGGSDGRAQD